MLREPRKTNPDNSTRRCSESQRRHARVWR
jgi:hypothetical protein